MNPLVDFLDHKEVALLLVKNALQPLAKSMLLGLTAASAADTIIHEKY